MVTNNPVRILTCYYRPKQGGFCSRYFRTIRALLNAGSEVHYLAVIPFPIDHANCYFHRFPWPPQRTDTLLFWAVFHVLAPLILLYLGLRWKITNCFAFGTNYGLFLKPLCVVKKLPLNLFLRGDAIAHHRSKNSPIWLIQLEIFIEGLAIHGANLYCVSDVIGEAVDSRHRWIRPRSLKTLRNNIDPVGSAVYSSGYELRRIGCVGMLECHKNQPFLLDILFQIKNKAISLHFFGVGPYQKELRLKAEQLGLESQVIFRGWVNSNHIWKDIDLLLMPSLFEGCPNSVLEAMANFVPVLASDIEAHREILPETNLLPLDDIESWHTRVTNIQKYPEKEITLLVDSQSRKMQNMIFDWDQFICNAITARPSN